jgi:hypothetical protein
MCFGHLTLALTTIRTDEGQIVETVCTQPAIGVPSTRRKLLVSADPHQRLSPPATVTRSLTPECHTSHRVPCLHDNHLLVFKSVLPSWGLLEQLVLPYGRIITTCLTRRMDITRTPTVSRHQNGSVLVTATPEFCSLRGRRLRDRIRTEARVPPLCVWGQAPEQVLAKTPVFSPYESLNGCR